MERNKRKFDREAASVKVRCFALIPLLFAGSVLFGCSSDAGKAKSKQQSPRSNVNAVSEANERGPNTPGTDTANLTDANSPAAIAKNRTAERLDKLRADAANKPISSTTGVSSRPAPEDSVMLTELKDVARETRIFKKHPVLDKVEKIHDGNEGAVKVFLKDGRTFDRPGNSIERLDQISSVAILQLIGVQATPQRAPKVPSQ